MKRIDSGLLVARDCRLRPAAAPAAGRGKPATAAAASPAADHLHRLFRRQQLAARTRAAGRSSGSPPTPIKAGTPGGVQVTGYADPAGSAGYNQRLSLRRASDRWLSELAQDGVPRNAIVVSGAGETSSGADPGQDRRVEVMLGGPPPSS